MIRPRCSLVTSLRLRTVCFRSFSIRSATATNSRPAAVISTRRVLRANSVTPSTRSTRLMVRVSAGWEVFRYAAAATKLPYSARARTVSSSRARMSGTSDGCMVRRRELIRGSQLYLVSGRLEKEAR